MSYPIYILTAVLVFGYGSSNVLAQTNESTSVLYVPLIGVTSVPKPLSLPEGGGNVTYHYAVKNFLREVALTEVWVKDDLCGPVAFVEGDDNGDGALQFNETWRYICTAKISKTTNSSATASGKANNITATHKAFATVVVGSKQPPPLVSIVNITKVAYPLSLPAEGGDITFTYRVNNPGVVPLSGVSVVDDKCSTMSAKLGDTNGNNLLDINEVWIYTCTTHLTQTTTNVVSVTAFANGLKAIGYAILTVEVDAPRFPQVGAISNLGGAEENPSVKIIIWKTLSGILVLLIIFFLVTRRKNNKSKK